LPRVTEPSENSRRKSRRRRDRSAIFAGSIHLSPLYFLYDGCSAVYIFFALSGYVLTRSFERQLARPSAQILARIVRLGLPAIAATLVAADGQTA
jgi:peptidoglycan/LPS O-acetylase OafA/YrhL